MSWKATPDSQAVTAVELRRHVIQLEAERSAAVREGLGEVTSYMADLVVELEYRRHAYVAAAVTEIATLRAELFGEQTG
jgi:hypothetical protein